jgi:hypothetical protein
MRVEPRARRLAGALLGLTLAATPVAAAELEVMNWNYTYGNGRITGWVQVANRSQGGTSGSLQTELRLSTAPHGQRGQFYTLYRSQGERGLAAGYNKKLTINGPYEPGRFQAGQYYLVVCAHEYTGQGWVNRACRTSTTLFTVPVVSRPAAPSAPAAPPRPKAADVKLGEWGWKISNGQASAQAKVFNYGGVRSGSLRLQLKLCDEPFGEGGGCYTIAKSGSLQPLDGGYNRKSTAVGPFDVDRYEDGDYYVVLVLQEYTGQGDEGFTIRAGATSTTMYRIGAGDDEEEE